MNPKDTLLGTGLVNVVRKFNGNLRFTLVILALIIVAAYEASYPKLPMPTSAILLALTESRS